jgi:hypothetical protein
MDEVEAKRELTGLIEKLEVSDTEKEYLQSRWLNQIVWMDFKSRRCRRWFHLTRGLVLVGGIIVPAMVASEFFIKNDGFHWTTVGVSLFVGIVGALEVFFHLGDKWRHYRANVESLKTEGWLFSLRSGRYRRYGSQAEAFPVFAERVEELLQRDVSEYLETVRGPSATSESVMRAG